jgi:phosphatidylglycerol:prolipoprotein diacylglycerol transferase
MRPVLLEFGPIAVHAYGVMIVLAGLSAWWIVRRELERLAGRGDAAGALTFAAVFGGLVGARGYYVAEHFGDGGVLEALSGAGFTWYGGVLGGAAAVLIAARVKRLALPAVLGAAAPALALGYGIGRIGCQLAGDGTYGSPSDLPWAMSYPNGEDPTTARVHPTPIYETLASLLIFWVLWHWRERLQPLRAFALYLVLAGAERFLVEFLRINDPIVVGLTQPQLFALASIGLGLLVALGSGRVGDATSPLFPSVAR